MKKQTEKVESYRELKERFDGLRPELNSIQSEIDEINREDEPLETEYLKFLILEDERAAPIKKQRSKLLAKRKELKEELEEGRKKLKIMSGILTERRGKARTEVNKKYLEIFESKVRKFVKALRECEAMERELFDIREQGRQEMRDIDASQDDLKIPHWPEVLLPSMRTGQVPVIKEFVKFLENNSKIKLKE